MMKLLTTLGALASVLLLFSAFTPLTDANISDAKSTAAIQEETVFSERMVFFDRAIDNDAHFELLKKVILKAEKLGFNTLVLNQEYMYARLSHKNPIMDKVRQRFSEAERLAHAHGLKLVAMHFNAEVPTTVVMDGDPANRFFQKGMFNISEANFAKTHYLVMEEQAVVDRKTQKVFRKGMTDSFYHFRDVKPNTEYKLTLRASTKNYTQKNLKVSVLDEDYKGENGKVLYGIQKYFRNIPENVTDATFSVYFNSLNHKNMQGAFKVYIPKAENIDIASLTLQEVGYTASQHVARPDTTPRLESDTTRYKEGVDYRFEEDSIALLSATIKAEKSLDLSWYPRVDVSRFYDHETNADACADAKLYESIINDQFSGINRAFNGKVDAVAFNNDEWREAGWNEKCQKLYEKEFHALSTNDTFTGGDYIGITTRKMIETIRKDANDSTMKVYVMSDMFDPNFNAKDPYMGVKDGALGAVAYLPENTIALNWFPNPYEPGLEDKTYSDFQKSAKHFADHNISQVIAGYHDDMRNLDANIAIYRDADAQTKKSIVGFMFLIWHQYGKSPSYDHMDLVVDKFCKELPGKWPQTGCEAVVIP